MKADPDQSQDQALLRRFASKRDEAAFRALVEKYTNLVFGVAMRRTGRTHAAEEVVQLVFLALAKKAGSLGGQRSLGAWLHRAATFESLKSLRSDATHQRHLAMIREQHDPSETFMPDEAIWREVRPHLDQLLDRLSATDREILVLHFFEGLPFADVARIVGSTAGAAQKRSVRALRKLAGLLKKRDAVIPVAALTVGLGAELAPAAPASLAANVTSSVLASTTSAAAASSAAATITSTIFTAVTTTKIALAATFIIAASVPVGLKMSSSNAAASKQPEDRTQAVVPMIPNKATTAAFDPDQFRAALKRLVESGQSDLARVRRLKRLLFSLDLDEIQVALAVLEEFEIPNGLQSLVGATFARWAELDPENAIVKAANSPPERWGYYPLHGAWDTWAYADWEAAHQWVSMADTPYQEEFLFWGYLDYMATMDGELTVQRARQLGESFPGRADDYFTRSLRSWTKHDPEKAIAWMDGKLTDPVQRDNYIGEALESLGDPDPVTALSHVSMLENSNRLNEVRYNIFWGWSLQQPQQAAEYFARSKAGEQWDGDTVRHAGEALARNLPKRAIEIARTIENPTNRDSFYVGILGGARQSDYELVLEAAEGVSAEGARMNGSLRDFMADWEARDRPAALAWLNAMPEGPKKAFAKHMFPQAEKK